MEITNEQSVGFRDALYNGQCKCGNKLSWEANFDADGTNYYAECCGLRYVLFPNTMIAAVETA